MRLVNFPKKAALKSSKFNIHTVNLNGIYKILLGFIWAASVHATVAEFNSTGGTSSTNGLHFYIEDTTKIQVKRLDNTGQVYSPNYLPSSTTPSSSINNGLNLDNGIFINANNKTYGPDHDVLSGFVPDGTYSNTYSITPTSPANPSSSGIQQIATGSFGVSSGPQVSIIWKYTTPLDFVTAEVTLTIPSGYSVTAAKPVRYYHVFDTYLGGNDKGCGFTLIDSNGKRVMGTYPPPSGTTTCPSNSSIPGGVSVVESFRERSGPGFSKYCAASWYSFYLDGSPNCSILQDSDMSNTISSVYEDTGIGIEYNFTSAGTYTFSYDFVVGSPNVPVYDHLEIQHDGSGTLCAENVTVLACTSSTVPCPPANLVNTGILTGAVTVSPTTPAVTLAPATFSLGASGTSAIVSLLAASPGGTYILSTSGLSAIPLNGIRCWNTATLSQSCSFNISNVPCVSNFECIETGIAYNNLTTTPTARNPLYTKLAGSPFKFDVVALQTGGVQATAYTAASNVTVELFDDTSPPATCSAYTSPVASQSITFAATDAGRKTVANNFNITNAYRKLRCRVKELNITPTVYGCSSDQFSVRPSAATLTTSATAAAPSATATPVIKAGATFTQSATTTGNYSGTLNLDTSKLTSQITSQTTTQQSGGVVGTLTPPTLVANASAVNATYSEVGYLYLAPGAYRDDTFTSVDSATGDCITSTASNNNLADTLISGKYGCSIGSTVAISMGRFIPDHFTVVSNIANACTAGSFTYMGQPFTLSTANVVEARNSSEGVAQNYSGGYAPGTVSFGAENADNGTDLSSRLSFPLGSWTAGNYALASASGAFSRPTTTVSDITWGAFDSLDIGLTVNDSDVTTTPKVSGANMNPSAAGGSSFAYKKFSGSPLKMRFGRLRLENAYGSELLDLPMSLTAEYWDGNNWIKNMDDSCSSSIALSKSVITGPITTVCAWDTGNPGSSGIGCATAGTSVNKFNQPPPATDKGNFNLNLKAPGSGNTGSLDITAAAPGFLQFNWKGAGNTNPSARATFGIYKSNDSQIYLREVY